MTMYYDGTRALHGGLLANKFRVTQLRMDVFIFPLAIKWLYDWAQVGDWVYVWDPSGRTPTDPAFYTQGGSWVAENPRD